MLRYFVRQPILIAFLSVVLGIVDGNFICPKFCNQMACDNAVLTCSIPGLISIPTILPPKTDKVLLLNQDFSKAMELSYSNISNYGPPEFKIGKIAIHNSQLNGIASESFSHLQNLQILDLSFNKIKIIEPRTFEALNLNFLRLDGNIGLQFLCTSFQKSIIRHLSLMNCSISSIDFCILKPIIGVLKKLFLSHNLLKTIDQKFEFMFQRLEEIRLNDNRFQCNGCELKWLSRILKWRFSNFNYTTFTERSLVDIFPKCVSPPYLKGSFIHRINEDDFVCNRPAIRSINVIIDRFEKLTLSCNSFSNSDTIVWIRDSDLKPTYKSRATIDIQRSDLFQQYYCLVSNRKGNVSTKLNINWPRVVQMNHAISHSTGLSVVTPETTMHNPRFSLLELVAAVVATFTIFLVLFIIIIKYSLSQRDNKLFTYPIIGDCNKKLKPDPLNHTSLTTNYHYQDAEAIRYDWSGNTSFCNSQTYDIPVSRGSVFLDFKTHEQIQRS